MLPLGSIYLRLWNTVTPAACWLYYNNLSRICINTQPKNKINGSKKYVLFRKNKQLINTYNTDNPLSSDLTTSIIHTFVQRA